MSVDNHVRLTRRGFVKQSAVWGAVVAFGGMGAVLNGCVSAPAASSASSATEAKTDEVIVAMTKGSEPDAGYDPIIAWGCTEHGHDPLIQSTLVRLNASMEFENDLARAYSVTEDGLTWTFTIRDDAQFTDGVSVTAKDVAFTINKIIDTASSEVDFSYIDKAQALDDTTVEIAMKKPYNVLLYMLANLGIVPEHAYGDDYGSNPIGSGRYMLEQWDRGQQVILKANPDYYGEAPNIKRLVVLYMDEDAALAGVQSGQVDVAYTAATLAGTTIDGYQLANYQSVDSRGISLPNIPSGSEKTDEDGSVYSAGNDVTCDVALRRAINYGTDRKAMVDNVLNGYGTEAFSVGDGMPWSSDDMKVKTDVARAQQLLEEGGWAVGEDGIRSKDGTRAAFDLLYPSSDSVRQALAYEFANQMKTLGIEVTPQGKSWDEIYPLEYSTPVLWGWGATNPSEVYTLYHSQSAGNYASYASDATDQSIDAALAQTKIEDSYDLWKQSAWNGSEGYAPQGEASWVWFANIDHLYFVNDNLVIADQVLHPHGHGWSLVNNVDSWKWK